MSIKKDIEKTAGRQFMHLYHLKTMNYSMRFNYFGQITVSR